MLIHTKVHVPAADMPPNHRLLNQLGMYTALESIYLIIFPDNVWLRHVSRMQLLGLSASKHTMVPRLVVFQYCPVFKILQGYLFMNIGTQIIW